MTARQKPELSTGISPEPRGQDAATTSGPQQKLSLELASYGQVVFKSHTFVPPLHRPSPILPRAVVAYRVKDRRIASEYEHAIPAVRDESNVAGGIGRL